MEDYMLDEPDYDDETVYDRMEDDAFLYALDPDPMEGEYYDFDEVAANASSDWENSRDKPLY